jgi:hypothetical protein
VKKQIGTIFKSDTQLAFCNILRGGVITEGEKRIRVDLIFPELLSDNLSDVPDDIFQ